MTFARRICLYCGILAVMMVLFVRRAETHKPITSKYTYTEDVFPIFSERCGQCHVAGGVAPMSLVTYKDSMPWAESIRGELIAANMPPWYAETGFGEFRETHRLSPRELDILMTWATGGAPQGPPRALPVIALDNDWKIGKPDLLFPLALNFTLAADQMEETREFVLQAGSNRDRWVRAVDLVPGAPAIVRDAVIYTRKSNDTEPNVLGLWLPGEDPVPAANGAAFRWAAGAELIVRIHYRKTWKYEGEAVTDRSTVGVYLSERPGAREVKSLRVTPALVLNANLQALALRPDQSFQSEKPVRVEAVLPDGSREPMINLTARPGWERRYWFARPILLPRGTRIEAGVEEGLWLDFVSQD